MIFPKVIRLRRRALVAVLVVMGGIFLAGVAALLHTPAAVSSSAEGGEAPVELPILMYHHVLKYGQQLGAYTITPTEFEKDLQYIESHGYTTIDTDDLIGYVYHGKSLPEKPIMITFDDGYYSNYFYAYPLLKKYNMKAVISIIGKYTDLYSERGDLHVNYSHLNWDQLLSMENTGTADIQNHTYDLHTTDQGRKGCKKNWGEGAEEYKAMLRADVGKLSDRIREMLGKEATFFAYPFGFYCEETDEVLKEMGFLGTFSSEEGINYLTRDPDQLFHLKRNNRPHDLTSEDFFERVGKHRKKDSKSA